MPELCDIFAGASVANTPQYSVAGEKVDGAVVVMKKDISREFRSPTAHRIQFMLESHITNEAVPRPQRTEASFARLLDVRPEELNRYLRWDGGVSPELHERILKGLEKFEQPKALTNEIEPTQALFSTMAGESVRAIEWVLVPSSTEIKTLIASLSTVLEQIIAAANQTNLPDDQRALTKLELAQLIALLETALHLLKAPMIEKGLLKSAEETLKKAAEKTLEKQSEQGLGQLANWAGKLIGQLIDSIF